MKKREGGQARPEANAAQRAFLHLAEGNEIAVDGPSTARKAVVVLLTVLFLAAVPMLWANSAQGDDQAVRAKVSHSDDDENDDNSGPGGGDDDDSSASVATAGTGSKDSARTAGTTRGTADTSDDGKSAKTGGTGSRDSARTAGTTRGTRGS